jgi:asparagine synthase (glutamine-hydrolysing)
LPGAVLPKVDRMSMQHSLEVRAPLLGKDIATFAMGLAMDECYAAGQGKLVLKRVAERYLPPEWMRRPKRGFGLPMDMWGAETLMPALTQLCGGSACRLTGWIPRRNIDAYLDRLARDFQPYRAWSLFILETWLRTHPAEPAVEAGARGPVPAPIGWSAGKLMRATAARFKAASDASKPGT